MEQQDTKEWLKTVLEPYGKFEKDSLVECYTESADYYERLTAGIGYEDPNKIADAIDALGVAKDSKIFDLACGTGLVGNALAGRGYTHMSGVDAWPVMLEKARAKGTYTLLEELFLGSPDTFPEKYKNQFDIVTACGIFWENHVGVELLDEMILSLKTGGHTVFIIRDHYLHEHRFQARFDELAAEGKWEFVAKTEFTKYHNSPEEGLYDYKPMKGLCMTFKKL